MLQTSLCMYACMHVSSSTAMVINAHTIRILGYVCTCVHMKRCVVSCSVVCSTVMYLRVTKWWEIMWNLDFVYKRPSVAYGSELSTNLYYLNHLEELPLRCYVDSDAVAIYDCVTRCEWVKPHHAKIPKSKWHWVIVLKLKSIIL